MRYSYAYMNPEQNPYDFITNPAPPPRKRSFLPGAGSSTTQRILVVVAGLTILIIVSMVVISLLSGSGGSRRDVLLKLAQQQAEIIRVSEAGTKDAASTETRAYAAVVKQSLTTVQNDTLELLAKHGIKSNDKRLAQGKEQATDEALAEAKRLNRYDEALNEYLINSLTAYRQEVRRAFESAKNGSERQLLDNSFSNTAVLLRSSE